MRYLIITILLFTTYAQATGVNFISGNELARWCKDTESPRSLFCTGYVAGVMDGALNTGRHSTVCLPTEVENGQLTSLVKKYMEEHPEKLHAGGSSIVLTAVAETFPCEQ